MTSPALINLVKQYSEGKIDSNNNPVISDILQQAFKEEFLYKGSNNIVSRIFLRKESIKSIAETSHLSEQEIQITQNEFLAKIKEAITLQQEK